MQAPHHTYDGPQQSSARRRLTFTMILALIGALVVVLPSFADHGSNSVTGSNFEIDHDANLTTQDDPPSFDWEDVTSTVQVKLDRPSGTGDDALKGSEDTPCPEPQFGTIPNNKSDLLEFGIVEEAHPSDPAHAGYLHMFWSRLQDPKGTTNMTFEFNQSEDLCTGTAKGQTFTGITPQRTVGDLLVTYDIDRGGTQAAVGFHRWNGSTWGPQIELLPSEGIGSINTSGNTGSIVVDAENPDGATKLGHVLGPYTPRTFGEASVSLEAIFGGECISFGSAYVKSRASDSINSQLKDFIAPLDTTIELCGGLTIKKITDPPTEGELYSFEVTSTTLEFSDDFQLAHNEEQKYTGEEDEEDALFPGTYIITELEPDPARLHAIECKSNGTVIGDVDLEERSVTIDLESKANVVCTFTNRVRGSILVHKVDDQGDLLDGASFGLIGPAPAEALIPMQTTTTAGVFCADNLVLGSYQVTETTVPDGFTGMLDAVEVTATSMLDCDDRWDETVPDRTVTNNPNPGTVNILKEDDAGNPLSAIGFTLFVDSNESGTWEITETTVAVSGAEKFTGQDGTVQFTDVPLGFYCAVETTSSSDHEPADPQCFEIGLGSQPGEGQTINLTFVNWRLHSLTVIACHQGTNDLHQSEVTLTVGSTTTTRDTIATVPQALIAALLGLEVDENDPLSNHIEEAELTDLLESQLCGLGGAQFDGLGHDTYDAEIEIASHQIE